METIQTMDNKTCTECDEEFNNEIDEECPKCGNNKEEPKKKITLKQIKEELTKFRKRDTGKYSRWDSGYDDCIEALEDFFGFERSLKDYSEYEEEEDDEKEIN